MGSIKIICACGSDDVLPVRTTEVDKAVYEHIFVCKKCDTTMGFRLEQIISTAMKREKFV